MPKYRFSEIAINVTDKRMPVPEDKDLYIAPNNLDTDTLSVPEYGYKVDLNGTKLIMHKGDMLFGRREPQLKKAAVAPHDGLFSAHGMIFHPREEVITKEFFPFFISSDYFFDAAIRISVGSLSPTVNWKDLKDLEFDIPDLSAQQEYARVLWAMIRAKKAYKELVKKTDDLVKSQFIEMFGDPEFGTMDAPVCTLGELITIGPQNGLYKAQSYYRTDGSGVPIVRVDSFYEGVVTDYASLKRLICSDTEIELYHLENDDLIFNRVNGSVEHVGKCARIQGVLEDTVFESNIMRVRTNPNVVDIRYLSTYLCSDIIRKQIKKVARVANQASVNQDNIRGLLVPLPSMERQKAYAALVDQSDKSKFAALQTLKEITDAQKALMKRIFE